MKDTIEVVLKRDKECRGSVRFKTDDDRAPITNVYVSRATPGVNDAREVKIVLEVK